MQNRFQIKIINLFPVCLFLKGTLLFIQNKVDFLFQFLLNVKVIIVTQRIRTLSWTFAGTLLNLSNLAFLVFFSQKFLKLFFDCFHFKFKMVLLSFQIFLVLINLRKNLIKFQLYFLINLLIELFEGIIVLNFLWIILAYFVKQLQY